MAEVLVSINKQQPNRLYISPDGRNAIVVADVIPFGPNPFAPARAKLQAADGPALGPKTPVISIVEFSDLQCPHCKRSEEHTSELQSRLHLVCRLLLEKKKKLNNQYIPTT